MSPQDQEKVRTLCLSLVLCILLVDNSVLVILMYFPCGIDDANIESLRRTDADPPSGTMKQHFEAQRADGSQLKSSSELTPMFLLSYVSLFGLSSLSV